MVTDLNSKRIFLTVESGFPDGSDSDSNLGS
jgi:hypothetical protein